MIKKPKFFSLKPVLSVISLILAFAVVCGGVLLILNQTGVINLRWARTEQQKQQQSTGFIDSGTHSGKYYEINLDDESIRNILENIPFYETFFLRSYVTYVGQYGIKGEGSNIRIEAYDVYKWENRYKVITYNSTMTKTDTVICDGEKVRVIDETLNLQKDYPVTDDFAFNLQSPIPDFSVFRTEKYEILSAGVENGEYIITCRMSELGMTDEIHINMNNGFVTYFKTVPNSMNGRLSYEYSIDDVYIGTSEKNKKYTESDFAIY